MFEVWKIDGRRRTLIARFRMLSDANRFVGSFDSDVCFEIIDPMGRGKPRRRSGVVAASEHPEEFIADAVEDSKR